MITPVRAEQSALFIYHFADVGKRITPAYAGKTLIGGIEGLKQGITPACAGNQLTSLMKYTALPRMRTASSSAPERSIGA